MADFNSSSGFEIIDLVVTTTTSLLSSSSSSSSAPTTSSFMTSDFYNFNSSGATWSPDFPEDINSDIVFYFSLYKVAVPLLFALIMLFGLVGNSLVIWVTITKRKMHTTVNQFLLNLAFSDISFLVVCVPFMAYHFAADDWLIGDIVCKVSQFILFVTVAVTVYTLVSIAVVRFLHIVYAHRMSRMKRWINPVIGVTWMVCSAVNVPVLLMYRVKELALLPETPYYYCGLQEPGTGKQLFLLFFIFTYVAPLSIIVTMYLLITRYLIKKRRRFGASTGAASPNPGGGAGRGSRASNAHVRRTSHASRIFIAIVVVFGLCWLPLHLHLQVVYFGSQPTGKSYQVFRMLCHVLAYSNSCVNPFIYHYVSSDFRQCLHSLIQPKWRRLLGRRGRSESTTTGCPQVDRTALRELGTRPSIAGPTNPDIVIFCDDVSRPDREPQNRFEGNSWVSGAPSSQTQ